MPRPQPLRQYADHRRFSLDELAFFAVARGWNREDGIDRRFEGWDDQDLRDAIIVADDEPGGLGFLHWDSQAGTWTLTTRGRRWIEALGGKSMLRRAEMWEPICERKKPAKYATRASESSSNRKPSKRKPAPVEKDEAFAEPEDGILASAPPETREARDEEITQVAADQAPDA